MQLPGPVRAAVGLAATVAEEARSLPDRAIELPMIAVSTVLQFSLRAQQRYAALTARGDEVLGGRPTDDPPPWATFDDPVDLPGTDADRHAGALLDEVFGPTDGPTDATTDGPIGEVTPLRPKRVSRPRTQAPSKFDTADDTD